MKVTHVMKSEHRITHFYRLDGEHIIGLGNWTMAFEVIRKSDKTIV